MKDFCFIGASSPTRVPSQVKLGGNKKLWREEKITGKQREREGGQVGF